MVANINRISLEQNSQITMILLKYINDNVELPCEVKLEALDGTAEAMMFQQLAGALKTKEDLIGGYNATFPFALYYRTKTNDTYSRANATSILNNIGRIFEQKTKAKELMVLGENREALSLEMTSLPSMIAKGADGSETYQALYAFDYKQNRVLFE